MYKIGLLSDTHGMLHPRIPELFDACDEIWHAGDIGTMEVLQELQKRKPVRAVYGNIDGQDVRLSTQEQLVFTVAGLKVYMIHIGGYPGKYSKIAKRHLQLERPDLFISGHSHILKVMPDKKLNLLHINPGAAGKFGFQKVSTLVRFQIENAHISNLEVIELDKH